MQSWLYLEVQAATVLGGEIATFGQIVDQNLGALRAGE
jgi:hypothetical protein